MADASPTDTTPILRSPRSNRAGAQTVAREAQPPGGSSCAIKVVGVCLMLGGLLAIAAATATAMPAQKAPSDEVRTIADSLHIPGVDIILGASTNTTTRTSTHTTTHTTTRTATSTRTSTSTETRTHSTGTRTTSTTSMSVVRLFCFTIMRDAANEVALMRELLAHGAGIYACDDWAVLSDTKTWLTPGPPVALNTTLIAADGSSDGVRAKFAKDLQFIRGWEKIRETARYKAYDFVVKVDPSTVFLPTRLRAMLKKDYISADDPVFYANCQAEGHPDFLFGAIEVYSRAAIDAYFARGSNCSQALVDEVMWEEKYMGDCMQKLEVPMLTRLDLLRDEHCGLHGAPLLPCVAPDVVSFHPFSTPSEYLTCWQEADNLDHPPTTTVLTAATTAPPTRFYPAPVATVHARSASPPAPAPAVAQRAVAAPNHQPEVATRPPFLVPAAATAHRTTTPAAAATAHRMTAPAAAAAAAPRTTSERAAAAAAAAASRWATTAPPPAKGTAETFRFLEPKGTKAAEPQDARRAPPPFGWIEPASVAAHSREAVVVGGAAHRREAVEEEEAVHAESRAEAANTKGAD